jgi:competence protein ComFB
MSIRNLMEDVVIDIVSEIISNDKDLSVKRIQKDDIVAYVLNRLQPKYVTSERGVIHGMLDRKYVTQQKSDILFLIYEAIGVIKGRRGSQSDGIAGPSPSASILPHIMGEVLEETTFTIVPDIEVTLLYGNKKAPMVDRGWINPYVTNRATRGYYHFWPAYIESSMAGSKSHSFTLSFSHPRLEAREVEFSVEAIAGDGQKGSKILPIVLLKVRDGVNPDFLYDS